MRPNLPGTAIPTFLAFLDYCIFHLPLFRSSQAREQPPPRLRSCQRKKAQCILPSWYTVYTKEPCYTVYMFSYTTCVEACIRVRCISFGFGVCPLYWEDQVFEYKYVVNLHWGWIWEISAFSFLFGISIWTMHHQLAKCAVIVVIISVYPCLLRRNNQCLNQWSPPSIYFTTTKRCSIFDKKIWRGKASLQQNEIVTFAGNYIVSIYLPLTKLKITDFFLY